MISNLIKYDIFKLIYKPIYIITCTICALLIFLSIFVGINEYKTTLKNSNNSRSLNKEQLKQHTNWSSMNIKAYKKPDPLQIFVPGVIFDIGRYSNINNQTFSKLQNSLYSEEILFAVFRFIDYSHIILIIYSLMALIFTYNAINGETESGTIRLLFSYPISRSKYIISKFISSWIIIVVPFIVISLSSCLILLLSNVFLTTNDWLRILLFFLMAVLFVSFFIVLGIFSSVITKQSSLSIMICLISWLLIIFIIPRFCFSIADQFVAIPSIMEIESKIKSYKINKYNEYYETMPERYDEYYRIWNSNDTSFQSKKKHAEKEVKSNLNKEIKNYESQLISFLRKLKDKRFRIATYLSFISPASIFKLQSMNLANTDSELKSRIEMSMDKYASDFDKFVIKNDINTPGTSSMTLSTDELGGINVIFPDIKDLSNVISDMPVYDSQYASISYSLKHYIIGSFTILFYIIVMIWGAWIKFIKYDTR